MEMEKELIDTAIANGATDACLVESQAIVVKEELAAICRDPGCPNYGSGSSCPPHVGGPSLMLELVSDCPNALLLQIEVPTRVMVSEERYEVFWLLHTVVATVEKRARELGYSKALGFAGGPCKRIFCSDFPNCSVLEGGTCRHPETARHSMSGYGVDVGALLQSVGWTLEWPQKEGEETQGDTSRAVGLVLMG